MLEPLPTELTKPTDVPQPARGNSPAKSNLVMGVATGLREEDLRLFARSLRRVAPSVAVVLLTKNPSSGAQKLANQEGIELVPLQSCYYGLGKSKSMRIRNYVGIKIVRMLAIAAYPFLRLGYTHEQCAELWREINKLVIHTFGSRYLQYLDFLENRRAGYGKVMLTDVRDVYFQADPFPAIGADSLYLSEEPAGVTLGTEPRNRRWVEATFGKAALRSMETRTTICAGVTLGGIEKIIGYLKIMEPELVRRNSVYIADQGIHNALAYLGRFDHLGVTIVKNETGPVLTMGLMKAAELKTNEAGMVVNSSGQPYPILHQYDRHPSIVAAIQRREGALVAP